MGNEKEISFEDIEKKKAAQRRSWIQLISILLGVGIVVGGFRLYFVNTGETTCYEGYCPRNQHCVELFNGIGCKCNEGGVLNRFLCNEKITQYSLLRASDITGKDR